MNEPEPDLPDPGRYERTGWVEFISAGVALVVAVTVGLLLAWVL